MFPYSLTCEGLIAFYVQPTGLPHFAIGFFPALRLPRETKNRLQSRWQTARLWLAQGNQAFTKRKENSMENKDAIHLSQTLRTFTGTVNWYRHQLFRQFTYTDGIQFLATEAQCYWLIDRIFALQYEQSAVKIEPFQVWELTVNPDQTATLTCGNGNDDTVYSEHISYTDFKLPKIRLFLTDCVLLLPTEY